MTRGFARWVGLTAVAAGMAALYLGGTPSPAQDAPGAGKADDPLFPKDDKDFKTGFTGCKKCHNYSSKEDAAKDPFAQDYKSNQFVLLSEGTTWRQEDPHSNAFKVLERPLGQQMDKILRATKKPEYKDGVTKAAQCLTCHAIDVTPKAPLAQKQFDTDDGVTCNACHGIRKGWQTDHYDEGKVNGKKAMPWRVTAPEEKMKAGLRNLRDPVVRADLCASCHVGSADHGRVVTHEMYAAGHPPLPPFELGTFMECQPKHWGYPINPELTFFRTKEFTDYTGKAFVDAHPNWRWDLYRFHDKDAEVYMARQVVAGAIASLRAEMTMIAADAKRAGEQHDLIDYARFDCYACHHDLKSPSDRQARGYDGNPPGRPPLKAWTAALPSVVVEHANGLPGLTDVSGQFQQRWEAVRKAAMSRPYGNPDDLVKAAGAMNAWCDEFLKKTANGGKPLYTAAEAKRLLDMVAAAATSQRWTADPEAAMHLTWAYVTLRNQMGDKIPADKLKALGKAVPVQVRLPPYSTAKMEPRPAGDEIGPRLDLFGRFQSKDFIAKFRDLSGGGK